MDIFSKVRLNNGVEMPWFGLGVFELQEGKEAENSVLYAFECGYRSIDTATMYLNEKSIGYAIKRSGIPREEIFLTTKIWNDDQGYKNTLRAFNESLEKLQSDYIDLYLIHWPKGKESVETWKAMEELYGKGKIKAIGISNFLINQLDEFLPECKIIPAVNQFEFHPELIQPELLEYCKAKNIQPEAWSPIMRGEVNRIPLLKSMAVKYGKTPVQIVLRWDIQKGVVTIPKSSDPERICTNADIFDFEINDEDMKKIDSLDKSKRTGPDPNNYSF
ncbi:MAG: aldo/keto reductase [Bacteroidales bacterium]|jgi:diketogulonate reductase-like aldo/keto reductase|nr:aldo/keto reductase [Bacteroidales bacterium]